MSSVLTTFENIDNALDVYYQQFGHFNYRNDDGRGIFLQYIMDEQLEEDDIEKQLNIGCSVANSNYIYAFNKKSFPIPDNIDINDDQTDAIIFYVLQHCYKYGKPPINKSIEGRAKEIGASIQRKTSKKSPRKFAEMDYKQENHTNNNHESVLSSKKVKASKKKSCSIVGNDGRSYSPKFNPKSDYQIPRNMTLEEIPSRVRITDQKKDIYQDMIDKLNILSLHPFVDINGLLLLFFDFYDMKTGEPLFCIADKLDEEEKSNRNYKWRIRDQLYPATEICNLSKLSLNELPITPSFINTQKYEQKIKEIQFMVKMLNDPNKIEAIFNAKHLWQKVTILKNEAKINKERILWQIPKQEFLKRCKDALKKVYPIKLFPMFLFNRKNEDGYSIDGLLIIRIDENKDIGISFKYDESKKIAMPSGLHVDIGRMERQCKTADPDASTEIGKCFSNFTTVVTDISLNNAKNMENKWKQTEQQIEAIKKENKMLKIQQQQNQMLRLQIEQLKQENKELKCQRPYVLVYHGNNQ